MRVVVVGATGNVGIAVLRRLRSEEGSDLVGVTRRPPGGEPPFDAVEWRAIDVADPGSVAGLTEAFRGAGAVVHLAWLLQPNHDERVMAATNLGGLRHVLAAVAAASVPHLVVTSSVGAYSPGPKRRRVGEDWPTGGIATSHYSRQKAVAERMLDAFEAGSPGVVVTRLRPGLVMQHGVGEELRLLFAGSGWPVRWLARIRVPVVPLPRRAISQVVHADDLADAVARIIAARAGGAFNVATEPVVGPREVAAALGARWLPVRAEPVRALVAVLWRMRVVAADPGWLDIALTVPVMSTRRIREELGWRPAWEATAALRTTVRGLADRTVASGSPHLAEPDRN